ncbi:FecR family protein [Flavobacterium piscis]|uniref:Ferric-dicitrate binding protein FerR (Iron transport regulator) n=1 Tax=Flavobacterium piscis TaxID=1114874 RepID=A0ABU1YDK7_9FLAO|nr:FecR family protein [Flavobacterium piscis]MDR7212248.1 ferric-dicitrate binding protein FerR (iron transport regulator) [Flavobacterium piscis]
MDFEKIESIIIKYFSQSANMDDLDILNKWIENPENQLIFQEYVKAHFAITLAMNDPDIKTVREALLKEIRKEKKKTYKYSLSDIMKYAAIAMLFIGIGFLLQKNIFNDNSDKQVVLPGKDEITLTLGNGNIKIMAADGTSKVYDANGKVVGQQNGKELVYTANGESGKLVYNTLNIPNGKRFNITLSDGTLVHLNAGSSITFPVQFLKNKIRKVFLSGEAYFEVAHDKKNAFVVNANKLDVQVYGTKFNVTNYLEDKATDVVLIEGSVSLTQSGLSVKNNNEVFLTPGYKGTFNKEDKKISNEKVTTSLYTSWMIGNLVFRQETFENIIQKLERHYNVVIINNNEKLAKETFNATIETDHESINQVFNYFKKVYQIEYSIVENKIIIH